MSFEPWITGAGGSRCQKYFSGKRFYLTDKIAMKPRITVYVKSAKVRTGDKLVEDLYPIKRGYNPFPPLSRDAFYEVRRKSIYNYVLPEDQKEVVEHVKHLSKQYFL
mgnify:FL=1